MLLSPGASLRRALRTCVFITGLWLLLLLPLGAVAHADVVAPSKERYGIDAASVLNGDATVRTKAFSTLKTGGLSLVRFDIGWGTVEPLPPLPGVGHRFDWSHPDATVTKLAQAGLRGYAMAGYSAPWASVIPGDAMSRPRNPADYAAFVAAAVIRYGTGGTFWAEHPELPALPIQSLEVWNEPNARQFWREQESAPRDYAALYLASRDAIRRVNAGVQVVVGGLVVSDAERFISGMFSAQPRLRTEMDAVGYHPYLLSADGSFARIKAIRRLLDRLGATKASIELTEIGWSLLDAPEQQRGEWFAKLARLTSDPALRVSRFMPYTAISLEHDPQEWIHWFGLLNQDGSAKPAFQRLAGEIATLERSRSAPRQKVARASRASSKNRSVRKARAVGSRAPVAAGATAAR